MSAKEKQHIKGHEAIARALKDLDVDVVFGLIGDANLYVIDYYTRRLGGRFVAVANEATCVAAAVGYAQVSGKVGVASVTHGPALTNTLTALIEGVKATVPIVLLAGDTAVEEREHLQKINQREFIMATGAGFELARTPATLMEDMGRAFRRAVLENRPLVFNIPVEWQNADVAYSKPDVYLPEHRTVVPSSDELDNAIGIIAAAKRPLVLGGRGAMAPEAEAALILLAERIQAPLATTLRASGLFAGDPYNLGVCGTLATEAGLELILAADCIIAFGASLNKFTMAKGALLQGKRIIQNNLERGEVGKHCRVDAGLVGDPALTAKAIIRWLDEAEIPASGFRNDDMQNRISRAAPLPQSVGTSADGTIDVAETLARLDAAIPPDRILATDVGRFTCIGWTAFRVQRPRSFVYGLGYGAIGLGLGEAIGAAEASTGRPTVLVTGDGGFMLGGLNEINTAVKARSNLIIIVCNDGGYGAEHVQFTTKGMDPSLSILGWPDLAPVVAALGAQAITVRNNADLEQAVLAIGERDQSRPLLIDVKLDPNCIPILY